MPMHPETVVCEAADHEGFHLRIRKPIREGGCINPDRSFVGSQDEPDLVNHPPHYTAHPSGIECIEITEWYNFNIGNAIKYLWRHDDKGGLEDLRKAQWYINREIERIQKAGG